MVCQPGLSLSGGGNQAQEDHEETGSGPETPGRRDALVISTPKSGRVKRPLQVEGALCALWSLEGQTIRKKEMRS
jgi:hypothetical protein